MRACIQAGSGMVGSINVPRVVTRFLGRRMAVRPGVGRSAYQ
jgi:hypothetical protein